MRTEQHRVEAHDGVELFVIDRSPTQRLEGSPTVVLAHGYALDHRYWHYQADALVEAGYRVVLWDQRGHGRSTAAESHAYSIKGLGDDLALLISEMIPHGPIVLIGHSMGGMTVMAYAGSHLEEFAQRIVGVGLISTSAGDLDKVNWGLGERGGALLAKGLTALVTTFVPHQAFVRRFHQVCGPLERPLYGMSAYGSLVPEAELALNAQMLMETDLAILPGFADALKVHDEKASIEVLADVPALILVGEEDVLTPPWHSEALSAHLPHAELVRVAAAGHIIALEHPEILNEELLRLLARAQGSLAVANPAVPRKIIDRRPLRGIPKVGLRQSVS